MKNLLLVFIILGVISGASFGDEVIREGNSPGTPPAQPFFNANKAAFFTTTSLAGLSIAAAMGAASAARMANTFALLSYSALAITGAATSIAAITAWVSFGDQQSTTDAGTYFQKTGEHATVAIAGAAQLVAITLTQAIVQGLAHGTSQTISRSISGPDQTIRIVR
ncbi:membrane hypothetical protein [Gammaproteobacteria bacterium]